MNPFREGDKVRHKGYNTEYDWWFLITKNNKSDVATVVTDSMRDLVILDYPNYKGVHLPRQDFVKVNKKTIIIKYDKDY